MDNIENISQKEYNDIPVYYCKDCLSLRIRFIPGTNDTDYCDKCGHTNIGTCSIEEWKRLYKEKYGVEYTDKY